MKLCCLLMIVTIAGCAAPHLAENKAAFVDDLPLPNNWDAYAAKMDQKGYHFNLNQPAHSFDKSGNYWALILHLPIKVTAQDRLYLCGPNPGVMLQIRNNETLKVFYQGKLSEVPEC